jgi:hypothetical protein
MSEEEYNRLLNQFPEKLYAALNWKKYLQRLAYAGRKTGRTDIEIGDDIRKTLRGELDDRTIRKYLPASMKHDERIYDKNHPGSARIIPLEQSSNTEPIIEVETEQDGTKFQEQVNELVPETVSISTPDRKIKLDTGKFRSDLRIALINGDKVWLEYNNAHEVISIKEM